MWFIKNVRHLLEKFIQRDSRFIVTFLGDLIKSLKIFNLEDILIDKEFEKILWFLYKLDMAILQINLLKYFLLNDPVFHCLRSFRNVGNSSDNIFQFMKTLKFSFQSLWLKTLADKFHFQAIFILLDFFRTMKSSH